MSERVCLLCFSFGKVYKNIKHTQLQVVYETLTDTKIQADTFPLCYICYAKLLKCGKLIKTVQQHDIENQGIVIPLVQLATFGTESWSLPDKLQLHNIKEESTIKQEFVEKASGSFKNEIEIEEGYPDSIVKNETTEESIPSLPVVLSTTKEPTNKRRHEENWEKFKNTKQKNSGQVYTSNTKKNIDSKTKEACKCNKKCGEQISEISRQAIFDEFWKLCDREDQWHYILRHVNTKYVKKMQLVRTKNRTQTIKYFLKINPTESIEICKKIFLNTLSISEKTVYTAIEKGNSEEVKDNRGQHENRPRKMSVSTEQSVIAHIKQFPVEEAHYVRRDTKKFYLEETLNISKMYRLYSDEWFKSANYPNDVKMATKRQYETVFNTKFNYSFHKPKKDNMCGQCTLYRQAYGERKEQLHEVYTNHIKNEECVRELRAKDKIEVDSATTVVATYDLEKVLTIPQSEVGIFHYKRKYPIYNVTFYNSLSGQGYCYLWHYQVAKRGASEIGSCVLNFIETESQRGIKNFIFYSDGCAGQNKNIFALYLYLSKKYGVNIIHRYFKTVHSLSEKDSMHSLIERAKKNHTIYTPNQMYGIIMNAKINGKKIQIKKMEQHNFFDLKEIMDNRQWFWANETNEKVMWTKIHEIKITRTHPDVIYLKYNVDDEYISLETVSNTRFSRGRRKETQMTSSDELRNLYRGPIALPKPLYDDLMSLCKTEAIPKHYHTFYNNLHYVGNSEDETDIERDVSNLSIQEEYDVESSSHCEDGTAGVLIENNTTDTTQDGKSHASDVWTKTFCNSSNLKRHELSHTEEKPYTCDVCSKKFLFSSNLKKHKLIHTDQKPYTCNVCSKKFSLSGNLKRHIKLLHTEEKPYTCDICNKLFHYSSSLKQHKLIHTGKKPYTCDVCSKKFSLSCNLKRHIKQLHTEEKPYTCDICNKLFHYSSSLKQHKRIHTGEKPYTCDVCSKKFSLSCNLKRHKLLHTEEKPYTCDVCNKLFKDRSGLKKHKLIHTGERYTCDVCSKKFLFSFNLKRHKLLHTEEKPYTCDICNKLFLDSSSLKQHKLIHTGEKPYTCDICNKLFHVSSSLKQHKLIHTGEKPYTCDVCSKKFSLSCNLKRHKLLHNDEKPHTCDVCNKLFKDRWSLKKHKLIHIREKTFTCDVCNELFYDRLSLKKHKLIHTTCDVCNKLFYDRSSLKKHKLKHTGEKPYTCDICSKKFSYPSSFKRHKLLHTEKKTLRL